MNEREWYYVKDGQRYGPVPQTTLTQLLSDGTLGPATLVWTQPMQNWQQASTIDFSTQAVWAPPPPGTPVASQAVAPTRPTAVTVFGILNIVFGSLGLLCIPVELIVVFVITNTFDATPWLRAWTLVSAGVGFLFAILQIASGIGLLYQKAWARTWSLVYGWFTIICSIVGIAIAFGLIASGEYGSPQVALPAVFGGLIGMIYPILLIVFMRRPNVKGACIR